MGLQREFFVMFRCKAKGGGGGEGEEETIYK